VKVPYIGFHFRLKHSRLDCRGGTWERSHAKRNHKTFVALGTRGRWYRHSKEENFSRFRPAWLPIAKRYQHPSYIRLW